MSYSYKTRLTAQIYSVDEGHHAIAHFRRGLVCMVLRVHTVYYAHSASSR